MSQLKKGCAGCDQLSPETAATETANEQPTNWWHCGSCGTHLNRYRGMSDQSCQCGAEYNMAGQRLRADWRENTSWHDEDTDDLKGFEHSQINKEAQCA